ncbi:hypothetical protein [Streptomyces fagopyri]|uniref:hypothetical protein n=1 Tax=Streptomyces fagopyri TaxID=2662397 RepID=UPI0038246C98
MSAVSVIGSEQIGRHTGVDLRGHEGVTASWQGVSAARWYEDQLDEAASWHGVTAARWYEDQVVSSTNHS